MPSLFFQMPGCTFQTKWLLDENYRGWIKKVVNNKNAAECTVCSKIIDLTTMGATALTSHSKGKKHMEKLNLNAGQMTSYASKPDKSETVTKDRPSVETYVTKTDTLKAEIWHYFNTIDSNYSFHQMIMLLCCKQFHL